MWMQPEHGDDANGVENMAHESVRYNANPNIMANLFYVVGV